MYSQLRAFQRSEDKTDGVAMLMPCSDPPRVTMVSQVRFHTERLPGPDNVPELPQKYTTSGHVQPRLRMTFGDHTLGDEISVEETPTSRHDRGTRRRLTGTVRTGQYQRLGLWHAGDSNDGLRHHSAPGTLRRQIEHDLACRRWTSPPSDTEQVFDYQGNDGP